MDEKHSARKAAFARRKAAHNQASLAIERGLIDAIRPQVANANIIAGYMPIRTEISPILAMSKLYNEGFKLAVPVILGEGLPLEFHEWQPDCEMIEGAFGAMIPKDARKLTPDHIIAPLVAFDQFGTRLGYGGGYYDRSLEHIRAKGDCRYLGLAYDAQEHEGRLPKEPTDIPLDGIITETGFHSFSPLSA